MNSFVFCDISLCIGCGMCERQCIMSHYGLSMKEAVLDDPLLRQRCKSHRTPTIKAAVHCKQCENAPCMAVCPVGAILRRDGRLIFVDEDRCIGCKECMIACPFGAVYLGDLPDGRSVATKCDLCVDTESGSPACVKGCPKKALRVVDEAELKATTQRKLLAQAKAV